MLSISDYLPFDVGIRDVNKHDIIFCLSPSYTPLYSRFRMHTSPRRAPPGKWEEMPYFRVAHHAGNSTPGLYREVASPYSAVGGIRTGAVTLLIGADMLQLR
ncbi:unnamed protein product [Heligmosomoides polygyrus]|uniref:Uncharacterized protein n=1 Tax=Heligmosomoides polygyrus TaxID=6339 RepID=A0A183G8U1_HELPZ|nr:unnamed protein product [Heligmosomoides polygyrus]